MLRVLTRVQVYIRVSIFDEGSLTKIALSDALYLSIW